MKIRKDSRNDYGVNDIWVYCSVMVGHTKALRYKPSFSTQRVGPRGVRRDDSLSLPIHLGKNCKKWGKKFYKCFLFGKDRFPPNVYLSSTERFLFACLIAAAAGDWQKLESRLKPNVWSITNFPKQHFFVRHDYIFIAMFLLKTSANGLRMAYSSMNVGQGLTTICFVLSRNSSYKFIVSF